MLAEPGLSHDGLSALVLLQFITASSQWFENVFMRNLSLRLSPRAALQGERVRARKTRLSSCRCRGFPAEESRKCALKNFYSTHPLRNQRSRSGALRAKTTGIEANIVRR